MKKKRMTREQAIELLKNRKVYVNGKSAEIQKKLFELGFKWDNGSQNIRDKHYPFLYISDKVFNSNNDMEAFRDNRKSEISFKEILGIDVVPEFKENDIVVSGWKGSDGRKCEWIAIYHDKRYYSGYYTKVTFFLIKNYPDSPDIKYDCHCDVQEWTRPATEEEKQKLIDALKKSTDERAKLILEEVFGIKKAPECQFKPFDRVLVRDTISSKWRPDFYLYEDRMKQYPFICSSNHYRYCIFYEGNEHLNGTTDSPEE